MFTDILKYQEVDTKLFRIEMEIQNSKDRKAALDARDFIKSTEGQLKEMESKSADYRKQYDKLNSIFDEKQKSITSSKAKASKAVSAEEIDASILELNNASKELQKISSQLFNLIKQMDELSKAYIELGKKIKTAREKYEQGKEKLNALKASKAGEIEELNKELESLKKNVDAEVFEKYSKLRSQSIMPVITKLDGSHCGACGTTISQGAIEELNANGYAVCEHCRRILLK